MPGALGRAITVMEQRPEVSWTYGRAIELLPGDVLAGMAGPSEWQVAHEIKWCVTPGEEFIRRLSVSGRNHVPTCTAVVRGPVQRQIGGYRPELPHAGDLEMWLRLSSFGSVAETQMDQGVRRMHGSNMFNAYPGVLDLHQRLAAFDSFFATEGRGLPGVFLRRRQVQQSLAREAASCGRAHLRRARLRTALEHLVFAFRLSPVAAIAAQLDYLKRLRPSTQAAEGGLPH
jgi:hypothetical protein